MKLINFLIKIAALYFLCFSGAFATQGDYFNKGKVLFNKKEFEKSKFFFEKDIIFNPKEERSYLYLAKVFYEFENDIEEEVNLNNVLMLNPKNEEAIYMLTILKIKQSDYNEAKELIEIFNLVCKNFCKKKNELMKKFKKIVPEIDERKN